MASPQAIARELLVVCHREEVVVVVVVLVLVVLRCFITRLLSTSASHLSQTPSAHNSLHLLASKPQRQLTRDTQTDRQTDRQSE